MIARFSPAPTSTYPFPCKTSHFAISIAGRDGQVGYDFAIETLEAWIAEHGRPWLGQSQK